MWPQPRTKYLTTTYIHILFGVSIYFTSWCLCFGLQSFIRNLTFTLLFSFSWFLQLTLMHLSMLKFETNAKLISQERQKKQRKMFIEIHFLKQNSAIFFFFLDSKRCLTNFNLKWYALTNSHSMREKNVLHSRWKHNQ